MRASTLHGCRGGTCLDEGEVPRDEDVRRLDVAVQQAHLAVQMDEGEGNASGDGKHVSCGEEGTRGAAQLELPLLRPGTQGGVMHVARARRLGDLQVRCHASCNITA